MNLNRFRNFIIKIRENIFVEEDPNQNCRNYPTSEFASYTECDDHYVRKSMEQIAPGLNLTPVWLADDLDLVTTKPLPTNYRRAGKDTLSTNYVHLCSQLKYFTCGVGILQIALSLVEPFQQKSNSPTNGMNWLASDSISFQLWRWTKLLLLTSFSHSINIL